MVNLTKNEETSQSVSILNDKTDWQIFADGMVDSQINLITDLNLIFECQNCLTKILSFKYKPNISLSIYDDYKTETWVKTLNNSLLLSTNIDLLNNVPIKDLIEKVLNFESCKTHHSNAINFRKNYLKLKNYSKILNWILVKK